MSKRTNAQSEGVESGLSELSELSPPPSLGEGAARAMRWCGPFWRLYTKPLRASILGTGVVRSERENEWTVLWGEEDKVGEKQHFVI